MEPEGCGVDRMKAVRAGGRNRRCGPLMRRGGGWLALMAALAALLVLAPVASAAAPAVRAPAAGRHHEPVARPAVVQALALGVVSELLNGALDEAKSQGFGWLLDQIGLGDKTAAELAGIREQLRVIEAQLSEILAATVQLRAEMAQGTFSGLVAQATPIVARVDKGIDDLAAVANVAADDPARTGLAKETLRYIGDKLMGGEQEELAKRLTGEVGADGLIVAAYKVAKTTAPCCWTDLRSARVRAVFRYYEWAESRLLLLRVEYMHAHPDKFPRSYVADQIRKVETEIRAQQAMLRPSPGEFIIADTRTDLEWNWYFLPVKYSPSLARHAVEINVHGRWRMPEPHEVQNLIKGWSGADWGHWLDREAGGQIGALQGFDGVWTTHTYCYRGGRVTPECTTWAIVGNGTYVQLTDKNHTNGLLMVRKRTQDYWY